MPSSGPARGIKAEAETINYSSSDTLEGAMAFELRSWSEVYRDAFAAMQSDPMVMTDLGGPFDRGASDDKFDRYRDAWDRDGVSRWVVADQAGAFLGYAGVMKAGNPDHPLGVHYEIGWRFCHAVWGKGFATASARRALEHAWTVIEANEIVSYTAPDNLRSQGVMARLKLRRDSDRDFTACYPKGDWSGLVWVAERPTK